MADLQTATVIDLTKDSRASKEDVAFIFIAGAHHKFYPSADPRRATRARETAKQIMRIRRRADSPSTMAANLQRALRDWDVFCAADDITDTERRAVIHDYAHNSELRV
jgi:hypothetical protein